VPGGVEKVEEVEEVENVELLSRIVVHSYSRTMNLNSAALNFAMGTNRHQPLSLSGVQNGKNDQDQSAAPHPVSGVTCSKSIFFTTQPITDFCENRRTG
jgi:hypothetical protein